MSSEKSNVGIFVCAVLHDGAGNFLLGKRGQNARDRHGEWVSQSGRLTQEVVKYFELVKNTNKLNSFCKKFVGRQFSDTNPAKRC